MRNIAGIDTQGHVGYKQAYDIVLLIREWQDKAGFFCVLSEGSMIASCLHRMPGIVVN